MKAEEKESEEEYYSEEEWSDILFAKEMELEILQKKP